MLRSLVDDAWKNGDVNKFAVSIVRNSGVQPYDSLGQVRAIYEWVHSNFYFVNDPVSKEALRPTVDMLQPENRFGDCDDINANVLPALLGSIGFESRLVTIAADPSMPDAFTHIYCEVYLDGQWIPLDAARPGSAFGVAAPSYSRREWWSITDSSHGDYDSDGTMSGYSRYGMRGLGDVTTNLVTSGLQDVTGIVQSVVGPTIGPGGAYYTSVPAPAPMSTNTELLLLLAAAALIWAVM
jgi:hypothetical protein